MKIVQNDNPGGTFEFVNDSSIILQVIYSSLSTQIKFLV